VHDAGQRQLDDSRDNVAHQPHPLGVASVRNCMVGHVWEDATDQFRGWYLNLQTPLRRSRIGFDLWDQLLDVVVRPDRTWFWKDEDQFEDAIRLDVIGSREAAAVRAQGESLIRGLDALLPTGWEDWRPEPGWPVLELPGGWDRVDERTDETT